MITASFGSRLRAVGEQLRKAPVERALGVGRAALRGRDANEDEPLVAIDLKVAAGRPRAAA